MKLPSPYGGVKKKGKKCGISTSRYFTPQVVENSFFFLPIFLDVLAHSAKKNIFPLEKLKTLSHKSGPYRRPNPPIPPSSPLTPPHKGKIFFAFLDVSDHLEAKKKKKKRCGNHPILPSPPRPI